MKLKAEEIKKSDGILYISQTHWKWKLRVLTLEKNGIKKSPALEALVDWSKNQKKDFNKIAKVIERVGQNHRVRDEKHVKKSKNSEHENVYEMRAHRGLARMMFFYSEDEGTAIFVCTNKFWKTDDNQDQAFEACNKFRIAYEKQKLEEAKNEKTKTNNIRFV